MNKILKSLGAAFVGVFALASCTPDDFEGSIGAVPVAADYTDNVTVTVDQETNYATFSFKSAPGVTPIWIIDQKSINTNFTAKKYYRKAGTYEVWCLVRNASGISTDTIKKEFVVDKTVMNGFGGFDAQSDKNLVKNAEITALTPFYAHGDNWEGLPAPPVNIAGKNIAITLPTATQQQWQAQVPFSINASTKAEEGVTYDFSMIITSSTDHGGVTIQLSEDGSDSNAYFQEKQKLQAGEPVCFYMTGMPSLDAAKLKLLFDFGGNADNTEITVEDIVLIKSSDNTIEAPEKGEPEPVWVALNSQDNIWNQADPQPGTWFYAPNWSELPAPEVKVANGEISFTLPSATYARWQAQLPINLAFGIDDPNVEYDFLVVIESSQVFTGLVKLTDANSDDNFFFADEVKLKAGAETRFFRTKVKLPNPAAAMKLFFDFGGNPDNTEITIKNIILQVHRD